MLRLPPLALALVLCAAPALGQEAMNRARRDADNPLRMIIEAGKLKEARERARAAAARAPQRAVVPAAAASGVAAADPAPVDAPPLPAAAAEPIVETPPAAPVEPPAAAPGPGPEPAAIEAAAEPVVPPIRPPAPLRLATMVEPQTPRHLIGRLRGDVEVVVAFTVNADGSVSEPAIRSTTHKEMNPPVLEAVRQWRYEPTGAARAHSVQLVLREGG